MFCLHLSVYYRQKEVLDPLKLEVTESCEQLYGGLNWTGAKRALNIWAISCRWPPPHFKWVLQCYRLELRTLCLHSKYFTNWVISLAIISFFINVFLFWNCAFALSVKTCDYREITQCSEHLLPFQKTQTQCLELTWWFTTVPGIWHLLAPGTYIHGTQV